MFSPRTMSAAATCLVKASASILSPRPSRSPLQVFTHQCGAMFDQFSVLIPEGCRSVAINVELADHAALHEHRRHNLRPGLDGARKIAWVGVHVVNHDGLPRRDGGAADSLVERNALMWRFGADVRSEHQRGIFAEPALLDHVEADPVEVIEPFLQAPD